MKDPPSLLHLCPKLKSFLTINIEVCNSLNKHGRKLDQKLEKKLVEAIKQRNKSRRQNFKSINTIIMLFPQFQQEFRRIRSVFEEYDENSNGSIEIEELMKCLGNLEVNLKGNEIVDLYHYCDIDGTTGIQFNEFVILLCLIYLLKEPSASTSHIGSRMLSPQLETAFDTIIDAFLFLDKNGDGKLNKKELILALNEASPWERSPSHIAMTRFKEMDWDKNGEISLKEFLFALTKWVGMDSDDEEIPIAG